MAKAARTASPSKRPLGTASASPAAAGYSGPARMDDAAISKALLAVPEWSQIAGSIQRTFGFADFLAAMAFVGLVATAAEDHAHHPDILIRYNKVTLSLNTHDAGGITTKDFALAALLDGKVRS